MKEAMDGMKILVLSPVDLKRAAHNRLHDLIGELSLRHRVDAITTYAWWLDSDEISRYKPEYYEGGLNEIISRTRIEYLSNSNRSPIIQEFLAISNGKKILRRFNLDQYDVIFNYNTILSGLAISHILPSTPMVYDLADDIATMAADSPMMPSPLKPLVGPFARATIKESMRRSTFVTIATSELSQSYGIPPSKTRIIPNGVNTKMFRRSNPESAKRHFNLDKKNVIGYVGVLREWVDFEMMLGALAELKEDPLDPHLLVVGGEGRFNEFMSEAKRFGVQDRVISTGTIPYSDVPMAISAMDIGLIPFKTNSVAMNALPLKLFEYMACGVPVISQRMKPVIDAVGDNIRYASDATELAQSIKTILSSKNLENDLSTKSQSIVMSHWNWQSIGERLESVLQAAVSEKK